MTYEELKKAYEEATKKCSELETEKAELEKKIVSANHTQPHLKTK